MWMGIDEGSTALYTSDISTNLSSENSLLITLAGWDAGGLALI